MSARLVPFLGALTLSVSFAAVGWAGEIRGRVTDPQGRGIADAVVFVQEVPKGAAKPTANPAAVMDQVQQEFVPHVLPVAVGTEVSFPNHDQIHHHVYSFSRTRTFEIPLYKGEKAPPVRFDKVGAVKVGCNIHDWMSAVILVVPTPYFAVTGADGSFTIAGVPPGACSLAAWHEGSKAKVEDTLQSVQVGAGNAEVSFSLVVSPPPARVPVHGLRRFE
jgi:plastocyanin